MDEISESVGLDRSHMKLPQSQIDLLNAVYAVNKNIIVVMSVGSTVEMPWLDKCQAMVHGYLCGQDYYVLLFFLLAFVGWLWEVLLFLVTDHALINRGVYRGPYLPIYGAGGLLLCFLLNRLKKHPLIVFSFSVAICSVLEYFTSFFLEMLWGIRWWDYSGHFLNIHGRICLAGAVLFGLGGTLLVCLFLPIYEKWYHKIPKGWRVALTFVLLAIFILDATYAAIWPNLGRGISQPVTNIGLCLMHSIDTQPALMI